MNTLQLNFSSAAQAGAGSASLTPRSVVSSVTTATSGPWASDAAWAPDDTLSPAAYASIGLED